MRWKGKLIGLCAVCERPLFQRGWEAYEPETCTRCWFDLLDGSARKHEAKRVHE